MIRDLPGLAEREFDTLVVGGGIYGLTIAYDAAQRGLSVALIEKGDFAAATSFNHLKTLHGGLRYLQTADFRRMRESIRERRAFARIAPRFVAVQPFAMPTGSSLTRTPMAMKAAFALDALVGRDRNHGVDPGRHLPAGYLVSGRACRELFDGAVRTVASAAIWHDYQTVHSERLTLAFAKAASSRGASLANYTEATGFLTHGRRCAGVTARDTVTGTEFGIRARVIVNAAGPWAAQMLSRAGVGTRWPMIKAMNLVTSRPARKTALVAPTRAGRALVLLPWQGRTLVGTSESTDPRQPDDQQVRADEVTGFLAEVNDTFPALALEAGEITLVHRGIVPAMPDPQGRLSLLSHSRVIDHAGQDAAPQVLTVVGVKYTTARAVAERAVDLIFQKLQRAQARCRTGEVVLPGAGLEDRDPEDPIGEAIRGEMAHTLIDVIVRRTGLGATGYPGDVAVAEIAGRMQSLLGWSDVRTAEERAALRRFYAIEKTGYATA